MNTSDDALYKLAAQMRCGSAPYPDRETLEASLVPLIRRVIRSGRGLPPLVQWVQRHLPGPGVEPGREDHADPAWAAPSMARLLCDKLLEQFRSPSARSGRHAGAAGVAAHETIVDG
jgi:hypothetical protein